MVTKFETLKEVLDQTWSQYEYLSRLIYDRGPPYNSHNWERYMEEIGYVMKKCRPEHPQSNVMCEQMMCSLVKLVHAAIAEGKDSANSLNSFLMEY